MNMTHAVFLHVHTYPDRIKETAMMPPEETYNFIVDQPFVYVIEDQDTGMILFMGRVNDL